MSPETRSVWTPEKREPIETPDLASEASAKNEIEIKIDHLNKEIFNFINEFRAILISSNPSWHLPDLAGARLGNALGNCFRAGGAYRKLVEVDEICQLVEVELTNLVTKPAICRRRGWSTTEAESIAQRETHFIKIGALGEYIMARALERVKPPGSNIYVSGGHEEIPSLTKEEHEERKGIDFWVQMPVQGEDPLVLAVQMKTIPMKKDAIREFAEDATIVDDARYPRDTMFLHPLSTNTDVDTLLETFVSRDVYDFSPRPRERERQVRAWQEKQDKVRNSLTKLIDVQTKYTNVIPVFGWLPSANHDRERTFYNAEHAMAKPPLGSLVREDVRQIAEDRGEWLQKGEHYATVATEPKEPVHV